LSTLGTGEEILFLLQIDEEGLKMRAIDPTGRDDRRLTSYVEVTLPDGDGRFPLTTVRVVRKGELCLRRTIHIFNVMVFLEGYLDSLRWERGRAAL